MCEESTGKIFLCSKASSQGSSILVGWWLCPVWLPAFPCARGAEGLSWESPPSLGFSGLMKFCSQLQNPLCFRASSWEDGGIPGFIPGGLEIGIMMLVGPDTQLTA